METQQAANPAVEPKLLPVQIIPIDSIKYVVDNHRQTMNEAKLNELAENIGQNGVKVPIKVCRRKDHNVLIFGHRRVKASQKAGLKTIPAIVAEGMTDEQIAEEQVIENIHREDLTPIDEAFCVATLVKSGNSLNQAAAKLGKTPRWARERNDLLRLDKSIHPLISSGRLPIAHALLISRVGDKKDQIDLMKSVIGVGYNSPLAKAVESDYVRPLEDLRSHVTAKLCKMGSAYWPKDVPYAGKQPCNGCTDNTNTEPDLFNGITLTSTKGNCSNEGCFTHKMRAWNKDPEKIRRDKERAAMKKAKSGGRVEPDTGSKRGESYEAREKRVAALKKKFPWTAEQKNAATLYDYGAAIAKNIRGALAIEKRPPAHAVELILVLMCTGDFDFWLGDGEKKMLPKPEELVKGTPIPGRALAMLWDQIKILEGYKPGVTWDGDVSNVPLEADGVKTIDLLEKIAAAWKIGTLKRPTPDQFKDNPEKKEEAKPAEEKKEPPKPKGKKKTKK